jgi:hypothetical protein
LGGVALRKIKKSEGKLDGKGFAVAGITISAVLLTIIVFLIIYTSKI